MKSLSILGVAASLLTATTHAHTLFTSLYINDIKQGQGDGTCVRQSTDLAHSNSPVRDLSSDDMACGVDGTAPVNFTCPAAAGAKLTFEYRENPSKAGQGFIDESHKGPVAVYAKRLSSPDADATGPGWFKLWGEGYDMEADKWATEKLIDANGLLSIQIPPSLPAGNYLFRPEVVAMHNTTPEVEPQFYIGCAQVFVESSVTGELSIPADRSVSIPGYLQPNDPSVTYNIYEDEEYSDPKKPYPRMGPKPFTPAAKVKAANSKVVHQTEGEVPNSCILVNANWCGVEVPSYNDLEGCWGAVKNCWSQADACWAQQMPSGGRNCEVWGDKCKDMDAHCSAKDFSGPPAYKLKSDEFPAPGPIPAALNAKDVAQDTSSEEPSTTRVKVTSSVGVTVTVIPTQSSEAPTITRVTVTSAVPVTVIVIPTPLSTPLETIPDFTPRPTGTAQPGQTSIPTPHCGGRRRRKARRS
ncbi:lytic polysaccharide monooxygenase [Astrocystis sublimbata]|nr:lytic polysaccharide monooxygenase [Astrocystis sublimbata]